MSTSTTTKTAYTGKNNSARRPSRATQTTPKFGLLLPNEPCFIDIEFQKFIDEKGPKHANGTPKIMHRIGRIAVLNSEGEVVLDTFAIYSNEDGVEKWWAGTKYRFGVESSDLKFQNGGKAAQDVEKWVAKIVKGRRVVLHGGKHDITSFYYQKDVWATSTIIDTQQLYSHMQDDGTPGLNTLDKGPRPRGPDQRQ